MSWRCNHLHDGWNERTFPSLPNKEQSERDKFGKYWDEATTYILKIKAVNSTWTAMGGG
jgi:hypothetical protein